MFIHTGRWDRRGVPIESMIKVVRVEYNWNLHIK